MLTKLRLMQVLVLLTFYSLTGLTSEIYLVNLCAKCETPGWTYAQKEFQVSNIFLPVASGLLASQQIPRQYF